MDKSIPFPQADDLNKILTLINIQNENDLISNSIVSVTLGEVTERQVLYYLSAASFLGLITIENGVRKFTSLGLTLRGLNTLMQEIELISLILLSPIFSKVYIFKRMIGNQTKEDVAEILKKQYPDYSASICERRAQTVLKWVEFIESKLNNLVN